MEVDREERIRQRTYELWEQAGRPAGESDRFWREATAEAEQPPPQDFGSAVTNEGA